MNALLQPRIEDNSLLTNTHVPLGCWTDSKHVAVAGDPQTERLLCLAESVAGTPSTVLLCGESGSGKEVFARYIHRHSYCSDGPFVAINCAALPESLIESELFGHEKGAFSGATRRHQGVFERAEGGTLLLDELSELPLDMQAKLLRVLQERVVYRVGGHEPVKLNVRVIATTNRDLKEYVEAGHFRRDLYYRINVFPIRIPPLRSRPGDVEPIARHLLGRLVHERGLGIRSITRRALEKLKRQAFPGNIRELLNVLERALIFAGASGATSIDIDHLLFDHDVVLLPQPASVAANSEPVINSQHESDGSTLEFTIGRDSLDDIKQRVILSTLAKYNGNRTRTAEALGISLRTVRNKIRQYRDQGVPIPE